MIFALLIDVLLVSLLSLLGFTIARLLIPSASRLEFISLAYPLGSGTLAWGLFMLSWLHVRLTLLSAGIAYVSLFLLLYLIHAVLRWRGLDRPAQVTEVEETTAVGSFSARILLGILGALFLIAAVIAVGLSYFRWDAMAVWSAKGYGIALEGSIFAARTWGAHALSYPLNIPIQIALFKLSSGDVLPGSKLIFPIYYLSLLLGSYSFLVRRGVVERIAGYAAVIIGTVPYIYLYSTVGYANVPMSCYIILGALWSLRAQLEERRTALVVGGILLGLAAFSRVEGILYSIAIIFGLSLALWIAKREKVSFVPWLLPWLVIGGSWLLFFRLNGAAGTQAMNSVSRFFNDILRGDFHLHDLRIIFGYMRRYLWHVEIWGVLFPLVTILLILGRRNLHPRRNPDVFACLLMAVGVGFITVAVFFVGSGPGWPGGVFGWLSRGFPRAFFPCSIMLVIVAVLATRPNRESFSDGMLDELRSKA
jgi:hypothetical protein